MIKKIQLLLFLLIAFNLPLAAQHSYVDISYQSFRPFIHFQLNFDSYGYDYSYHDAYEAAYLNGYMDGVNTSYYYRHRFDDLVWNIDAYKAGYRDGYRDYRLIVRLRGHGWYQRHRFSYHDYYDPYISVRIWLDGLSLAFLQAPAYKLPHRWKHRAHPHVITYRKYMHTGYRYDDFNKYYSSANVERRFEKRIDRYRKHKRSYKSRAHIQGGKKFGNRGRGNSEWGKQQRYRGRSADKDRGRARGLRRAEEVRRDKARSVESRRKVTAPASRNKPKIESRERVRVRAERRVNKDRGKKVRNARERNRKDDKPARKKKRGRSRSGGN